MTGQKRMCPRCRKALAVCRCGAQLAPPAGDGIVRLRREQRNGKTITVVLGVLLREPELKELGRQLKVKCGSGGSVKAGVIEIQGDHRELLLTELQARGYKVKFAGG